MATQLLIRHICDNCLAREDTEGNNSDIKTVPLNLFGDEREADLCSTCREGIKNEFKELLSRARRVGGKPKRAKVAADAATVEKQPDGKYHCPVCGRVTGESGSGLALHMRDKHPAERSQYRIVYEDKKSTPRKTAKKTAAKKTATRRKVVVRR
jgi:hypothetical protein